jgi:3-hydroxyisobutyrate dehydrogenase-like beta-hydroxyacid dehydrogenase
MSTISVALSRRLAAAHAQRIQRYVAAPVLGGPDAAAIGGLCIFVAGRKDTVSYCQPLFDAIGRHTIEISESPEQANLLQLCALGLLGCLIESLAETVALAENGGISPKRFLKLMSASAFGRGLHSSYGPLANAELGGSGLLTVNQGHKNARLLLEPTKTVGVATPLMNLLWKRLQSLQTAGLGDHDWLALSISNQQSRSRRQT